MGAAGGSLPSPGLSPLFCWGEQSLCPPEGVLVLGPPAQPSRVLVVQPWGRMPRGIDGAQGKMPVGLQVALSAICQHQGPSRHATYPLCRVPPARSPPEALSPRIPALPALRWRQLVPCCSPM